MLHETAGQRVLDRRPDEIWQIWAARTYDAVAAVDSEVVAPAARLYRPGTGKGGSASSVFHTQAPSPHFSIARDFRA